jgi:REP element-mobilizing transposase RayT
MARPLRIQYPGALYHVLSRGNARAPIFLADRDRRLFLRVLAKVIADQHWLCHAYCLMPNHYHLVINTPEPNLSDGMRQLNGIYTQRFNRLNDRVGHVFQGRFKSILVEEESHLFELSRYVVLNPVRAGMVSDAEDYRWSSLRATAGRARAPAWLSVDPLIRHFGSRRRYREFVREGVGRPSPCGEALGPVIGSEGFTARVGRRVEDAAAQPAFPRRERAVCHPPLERLFPPAVVSDRVRRDNRIREVGRSRAYTLTALARHLGLHRSTVSKIARSALS